MAVIVEFEKMLSEKNTMYAAAGASDLVAVTLRGLPARLRGEARRDLGAVEGRAQHWFADLRDGTGQFPARARQLSAQNPADDVTAKTRGTHDDLATRGRNLVGHIGQRKTIEELVEAAGTTRPPSTGHARGEGSRRAHPPDGGGNRRGRGQDRVGCGRGRPAAVGNRS